MVDPTVLEKFRLKAAWLVLTNPSRTALAMKEWNVGVFFKVSTTRLMAILISHRFDNRFRLSLCSQSDSVARALLECAFDGKKCAKQSLESRNG